MTTTDELRISDADVITAFRLAAPNHLLALKKATDSYQIVLISTDTATETSLEQYKTLEHALIAFFTGIAVELHLDPKRLMKFMANIKSQIRQMNQTSTTKDTHGTFSLSEHEIKTLGNMSAKETQQLNPEPNAPVEELLTPSTFYTPRTTPEWLQATKSFLDLKAGITIPQGEHYKLLAMNLKERLNSKACIIHLQDRYGKRLDLTLDQICQNFRTSRPQQWKHRQTNT